MGTRVRTLAAIPLCPQSQRGNVPSGLGSLHLLGNALLLKLTPSSRLRSPDSEAMGEMSASRSSERLHFSSCSLIPLANGYGLWRMTLLSGGPLGISWHPMNVIVLSPPCPSPTQEALPASCMVPRVPAPQRPLITFPFSSQPRLGTAGSQDTQTCPQRYEGVVWRACPCAPRSPFTHKTPPSLLYTLGAHTGQEGEKDPIFQGEKEGLWVSPRRSQAWPSPVHPSRLARMPGMAPDMGEGPMCRGDLQPKGPDQGSESHPPRST